MNTDRFKFRVWNKKENILHYDAEKTYDFMHGNPVICAACFGELLDDDNYIVEQCTGLKDKNGKLIYEGDVLKVPAFLGGFVNMRVFWNDNSCRWDLGYSGKRSTAKDMTVLVPELGNASEIIGNIHNMEIEK